MHFFFFPTSESRRSWVNRKWKLSCVVCLTRQIIARCFDRINDYTLIAHQEKSFCVFFFNRNVAQFVKRIVTDKKVKQSSMWMMLPNLKIRCPKVTFVNHCVRIQFLTAFFFFRLWHNLKNSKSPVQLLFSLNLKVFSTWGNWVNVWTRALLYQAHLNGARALIFSSLEKRLIKLSCFDKITTNSSKLILASSRPHMEGF